MRCDHSILLIILSIISLVSCASRGLAWGNPGGNDSISLFTQQNSVISWTYNWSPNKPNSTFGLEFVPMQWNGNDIAGFAAKVEAVGATHVLAFNEPDAADQAHMNATYAAQLWTQYLIPLRAKGIKIGAPAVTNNGLDWLRDFFAACGNQSCQADFIPLHWYGTGPGSGVGPFYDFIWSAYGRFQNMTTKFWITEYADTTWQINNQLNASMVYKFMNESLVYMDTLTWVERHAWFGAFRKLGALGSGAQLIDGNGTLTALGCLYAYNGNCPGTYISPPEASTTTLSSSSSASSQPIVTGASSANSITVSFMQFVLAIMLVICTFSSM